MFGQSAVQPVGALYLGEDVFVAGLAVEAAGQAEAQDEGRPVTFGTGGQGLAGECLGLLVTSLRIEGEDQPIAGDRRKKCGPSAASGSASDRLRIAC